MTTPAKRQHPKAWYWNTYFLFGIALAVIGVIGLIRGPMSISDPGQIRDVQNPLDPRLPWIYLGASALFLLNGIVSHRAYLQEFANRSTKVEEPNSTHA